MHEGWALTWWSEACSWADEDGACRTSCGALQATRPRVNIACKSPLASCRVPLLAHVLYGCAGVVDASAIPAPRAVRSGPGSRTTSHQSAGIPHFKLTELSSKNRVLLYGDPRAVAPKFAPALVSMAPRTRMSTDAMGLHRSIPWPQPDQSTRCGTPSHSEQKGRAPHAFVVGQPSPWSGGETSLDRHTTGTSTNARPTHDPRAVHPIQPPHLHTDAVDSRIRHHRRVRRAAG